MPSQPQQLQLLDSLFDTYEGRRESAKTLLGFSLVYLTNYFTDPPATFHAELFRCLEDAALRQLLIVGFRGSGKSTDGSLALPLWAALEKPDQYPFIILISDSTRQATLNITAIKNELETNALIKQDYGEIKGNVIEDFSLKGDGEEWQKQNIVLSNGVRILARSRGQKVRGLRHLQHRPKLVIVDDPEDGEWVRTKENRDKTERWLRSEVIGGIDARKGRLIVIGNLLHMDALLSRLKAPGTGFKVLEFPLIDPKSGACTWPAMYPTEKSLKDKERDMGAIAWQREMLLRIVSDDQAIITPEDITYYDEVPKNSVAAIKGHGIDLAISQKEGADYTTIVSGEVFYVDNAPKIFIRPNPYNEHVTFHNFMLRVRQIPGELKGANLFFVEDVAYQKAAIQEMERMMLPVIPMKPTTDKRSRLQVVAPYIKNGTVLFPRSGCEQLLGQLFNLGVEAHDDLCLSGDTQVLTDKGEVPLRMVKAGDFVMTRQGYKRVQWAGQTGVREVITRFGLTGTPDHPVITKRGVIHLSKLKASDIVYMCHPSSLHIEEKCIGETPMRHSERIGSITGATTNGRRPLTHFTAICGLMLSDQFRRAWFSITRTATRFIMSFPTLSLNGVASICQTICANQSAASNRGSICLQRPSPPPEHGIPHQKDEHGIAITPNSRSGIARFFESLVSGAEVNLNTGSKPHDTVHRPASNAALSTRIPVYNLLVEDAHEFFADGILVHNCDGLTTLLQGFANQGLELPKIHWIEG